MKPSKEGEIRNHSDSKNNSSVNQTILKIYYFLLGANKNYPL